MIIGLTGGIGSGKTTVAQMFRELGVEVVDSDQITRGLVAPEQPAFQKILEHFGKEYLNKDGTLNRAKLRSTVFESSEKRQWLEELLHPLVKEAILEIKAKIPAGKYIIVEIPLLVEANFENAVDRVLVIDCREATQIERVEKRDGLPKTVIQTILDTQASSSNRLSKANDVIENEGHKEDLKAKVKALYLYYNELVILP